MKKITALFLALVLAAFTITACSSTNENTEQTDEPAATTESSSDQAATTSGSTKTLIVYYSATGNTEEVANDIAQATGGDLFELEPVDAYTDEDLNWTDDNSRVVQEHNNEALRNVELVANTVDNWSDYDMVFIGYPIWWGIAAWPVNNFISTNDFTGKTVIPFCTSASSGIGDSGELLAEAAGTGNWLEGQRFRSGASASDVQAWVESLNR